MNQPEKLKPCLHCGSEAQLVTEASAVEKAKYELGEDLAKANIAYNDKSPHFKWRNFMGEYMYNLGYRKGTL